MIPGGPVRGWRRWTSSIRIVLRPCTCAPARQLYKPFGTGERSCIGRQFALHEAVLVLAALIRRYDLVPDPDYTLTVAERLTLMPKDFHLGLRRRGGT